MNMQQTQPGSFPVREQSPRGSKFVAAMLWSRSVWPARWREVPRKQRPKCSLSSVSWVWRCLKLPGTPYCLSTRWLSSQGFIGNSNDIDIELYICMGPQRAMIPTGDMVGLLDKPMANQGWCPRCRRLLSCQRKFHLMGHAAWAINAPAWPPWVVHDSTTTWKCLLSIPLWKTRLRWELWSRCGPLCEQTRHIQIGRDSKPQPYFTPRTCKSAKQKPEKNGRNRVRFCYQGTQDA